MGDHNLDDDVKIKGTHSRQSSLQEKLDDDVEAMDTPSRQSSLQEKPDHIDQQPDISNSDDLDYDPVTYQVKWKNNDPENPRNWSANHKAFITFQLSMLAFCGSCASSIIAPAEPVLAQIFGVSEESTVLVVSLYVLGFAFGPLVWGPLAEVYGRKISMLPAFLVLVLFNIGTGASQSAAAVFITRFFAGVFGSAPISNVSAALGDMYEPKARGVAVSFYAVAVCGGPTIGPTVGAALTFNRSLGWRWTGYIMAIWCGAILVLSTLCIPEMYAPALLKRKAQRLRKETGDERYWHPHESEKINLNNVLNKHLSRPPRMFFTEPMVTCIALYASFVYGLFYMTLEFFPIVFRTNRGWGPVVSTIPFLSLFIGVCSAMVINLANQPRYGRAMAANKGRAVPEARLPPMFIGGFLLVVGIFMFGWTAAPRFHWALPVVAAGLIGAGFNVLFQQCINFLVDTYSLYAASAVSANTVLRSIIACILPLVARPMFFNLGAGPACSILGGIAALALPVPFVFMKYGLRLRRMSKFATVPDD